MTLCSIVTAAKAVLSSVEAMRARCGVPAGTALTSTDTSTLCGDGGGRGLLSDTFWKIVAAVTDMSLLETVARPITPGEQVCHANPWIDQVRAWIDGIMPYANVYTLILSGFDGALALFNGTYLLTDYAGTHEVWKDSPSTSPSRPYTKTLAALWLWDEGQGAEIRKWTVFLNHEPLGDDSADYTGETVDGAIPGVYALHSPAWNYSDEYEYSQGSVTVLAGDQT